MTNLISILRIALLTALCMTATVLLFCEEQGQNAWVILQMIFDKGLAFLLFGQCARLFSRWSKTDPWLMAYDRKFNRPETDDEQE